MYDVLKYIHEHIREPLSAEETAKAFGYSKWYFCDRFKAFTDRTFLEYVRHTRVQLAALDILQGKKIVDVATDYGYESHVGFNKAFLREYGCYPNQYKKQVQNSQLYYETRRISMLPLSQHNQFLRDEVVVKREFAPKISFQRTVYFTVGAQRALDAGLSCDEIVAHACARVLENFTPIILPNEIITGLNFSPATDGLTIPANDSEGRERLRESHLSDAEIDEFFETVFIKKSLMWDLLWGIGFNNVGLVDVPPVVLSEVEEQAVRDETALGRCICSNHTVIGYEQVLKLGFDGLLKQVEHYERENGPSPLYNAMKLLCRTAPLLGDKYAAEAERLLQSEEDPAQRALLETIAANCRRVPRYPARTFSEAVQSLWFAHIVNTWEDGVNANSLGRLDQILYPYYKADIENGTLTKQEAFDILCCLWLKLYRDYDVQQSCVGGTNPDGSSAVNELSYLMLDATEQLDFVRCLSVRFGKNTEKEFLKRALEVVGHVQKGVPFFFNDDVMIPALESVGIPHEDACNYTQLGCVETVIPGKCNPHAVAGECNLLKAIEFVLGNGHSLLDPSRLIGIPTGELSDLATFDNFYAAVLQQVDRIIELACSMVKKNVAAVVAPKPYKSLLTEGCMERGRDFNDNGALYDYQQIMLEGIPNLADSLAVIRKFVYQDKKYTLAQLKEILEHDFPEEAVRREFINKAEKYGNDIDSVDALAVDITNHACDTLERLSEQFGMPLHAQPFTYLWMLNRGRGSVASPDGRRLGEPLAYSVSPMQGRDFNGLTAVFNSIAKLPAKRAPGTTSAIVEVDPKLFCDRNIEQLTDIFIAAAKNGLCNVQFNITDAETLLDAQKHPEHYNNLAVRVSGFSQKFNLLSPEMQDHIIGRTKHTCL